MLVDKLRRPLYILVAASLMLASMAPFLLRQKAHAYNNITARSIKMSNSKISAASTVYDVKFTAGTTAAIKSIAIDFCDNTPIIGDSCSAPAGFSLTGSPTVTLTSGITGTYNPTTLNSNRTLVMTKSTGSDSMTAGTTVVEFTINTVTNPSALGTFYARVYTYANDTGTDAADNYDPSTVTTTGDEPTDGGGLALSTVSVLDITAKVQERLTFCIYTSGPNCAGGSGSSIVLGDANGVLDPATQYTNSNAKFGLANNAASGAIVRMKGGTLKRTTGCADGTGQPCSIDPIGNAAAAGTTATEQFGLRLASIGANITATSPYDGAANNYAFDDNNSTGTQSTYGQQIASQSASAETSANLEFVGNITNTTESGIYTTLLTFIATGTY